MHRIFATIVKEWLLLKRDIGGLMLMLLMPAILIVVMALIQDAPFRDYQELHFELLLADNDHGQLSEEVVSGLRSSRNFVLIDTLNGQAVTDQVLEQQLEKGTYKIGISIPQGANAEVVNAANTLANKVADGMVAGKLPTRAARNNMQLHLYFDPATSPTYRSAITFALDKYITAASSNILVSRLASLSSKQDTAATPEHEKGEFQQAFAGIGIKEESLGEATDHTKPVTINSVQHNVPAWAIFGMFFIVVPIAGHAIREREEGSALRLQLIPGSQLGVALGKILFNAFVCLVQFVLMCCIGIWLLPCFGLPSLQLGHNALLLLPMVFAIALAATSYGYFIGAMFKTTNQAMPIAAISIVILSAIGGVWVPVDLLSPFLKAIAMISPLYWALDGIQHIMIRNEGLSAIIPHLLYLLAFATTMSFIGLRQSQKRGHSVS